MLTPAKHPSLRGGATTSLVEIPAGVRPGDIFRAGRFPVSCPEDAGPGDVLEIDLPPGAQLSGDDFLARLDRAEVRDGHARASQASQAITDSVSPSYAWRMRGWPKQASNPYLSEQQQQQQRAQAVHQQALARQQQRERDMQVEREAMEATGGLAAVQRAGRNGTPALTVRPLAAQREAMAALKVQHQQQQQQQHTTVMNALCFQAQQIRAPNAAAAQHEATLIARRRQAVRDPRGPAFRHMTS
jgi:hypothetical protein